MFKTYKFLIMKKGKYKGIVLRDFVIRGEKYVKDTLFSCVSKTSFEILINSKWIKRLDTKK